ncbi:polysaccharide biosynthesis tyrosine autokinase [Virgisporangium ochraceum]|uniref:non-specific protein-tyrosine kinase n=1 Tax=Virgisporangium ochraceum TaxID=65505 RepID=A0A8J4E8V6_9ACTN|nr:polysaccharide biosynthesis tyrosine autokinase [Virgisporangium ochraceum]GIJ66550.1 chromosome partitioning protein [Virgisporangium ochraceum]
MEVRDYLRAVRRHWWLAATAVLLGLGGGIGVTAATPPEYAASVTFFVGTQTKGVSDAYQGGLFSQQRIKSYADLLTSDRLAQAVVGREAQARSAARVQAAITATPVPDTVLLEATVTDRNRNRAVVLTRAVADAFVDLVQTLETPPGGSSPTVWVEVVAGPTLADEPVAPQPVRNVGLGLAVGLLIGIGAAVLREVLDTSVKSSGVLAELTGSPVLSSVPVDSRARKDPLIVTGSAGSVRAEALRQLRTNLQFVNVDEPARTLVVTSAVPGEGKSTTACNLAIVFAEAGRKVVLVDADLRRPRLAEYLGVDGTIGVTNVLAGQATVDDALQEWGTSGVFVLPSGSVPPNPSELLGSRNMAALLEALRGGFDMVIVDTPPLLPVTDGALAAALVDGTVLVFRCGKTSAAQVRSATEALRAVDAKVLGCVLNMTPRKGQPGYAYYGYEPLGTGRPWYKAPLSVVYRSAPADAPVSPAPVEATVDEEADDPTPVTGPPADTPEPAMATGAKRRTPAGRAKVHTKRG